MRYYETLYLINPNLADEEYIDIATKYNNVIEKEKGVVVSVDEWGKKTLAYELKKFDKGYYVLLHYCGDPGIVAELQRAMKVDERILQYQTVKLSDEADPEALKAGAEKKEEESEPTKAAGEVSSEEESESKKDQEENDGVR